jgi:hypothetical protein
VFALLVPSSCNKFGTSCLTTCNKLDGIIKLVTSLLQSYSWCNKNVARLTTQVCNNIAITWLHQTCWNNLATSLIIYQQGCYMLLTTCWQTCDKMWDFCMQGPIAQSLRTWSTSPCEQAIVQSTKALVIYVLIPIG